MIWGLEGKGWISLPPAVFAEIRRFPGDEDGMERLDSVIGEIIGRSIHNAY